MDSPGFIDCTLKIIPLANASEEHSQPNCLRKGSNQKNKMLQNKYTGSVRSKRNRTESDHQKCRQTTGESNKKGRNSCAMVSQLLQEGKGWMTWWSWRMQAGLGKLFRGHFGFNEMHVLALALITHFCIRL